MQPAPSAAPLRWSRWTIALSEASDGRPVCLSLCNTRHWRNSEAPKENLHRYADLVKFAVVKGMVSAAEGALLERQAEANPRIANTELRRTVALREAIACAFGALARETEPPDGALAIIRESFEEASHHLKVELRDGRLVPNLAPEHEGLELPRWQAALSALGLIGSEQRQRVRQCADDRGCGWLFLDTTRNGSRMFCFSNECGNRARQQRFRARHHASAHAQVQAR